MERLARQRSGPKAEPKPKPMETQPAAQPKVQPAARRQAQPKAEPKAEPVEAQLGEAKPVEAKPRVGVGERGAAKLPVLPPKPGQHAVQQRLDHVPRPTSSPAMLRGPRAPQIRAAAAAQMASPYLPAPALSRVRAPSVRPTSSPAFIRRAAARGPPLRPTASPRAVYAGAHDVWGPSPRVANPSREVRPLSPALFLHPNLVTNFYPRHPNLGLTLTLNLNLPLGGDGAPQPDHTPAHPRPE